MRLDRVRQSAIVELRRAKVEDAAVCLDWLIEHVVGIPHIEAVSNPGRSLSIEEECEIFEGVARRIEGEPIQYIVGWTEFFGMRLSVGPGVLIPRPETEGVVEAVLALIDRSPGRRVLDVGTGSGCIALAVRSRRPDVDVVACDISEEALAVARMNADELGLEVAFISADVESADSIAACGDVFDVIVSNPPYIPLSEMESLPQTVLGFEPHIALSAGDDPLRYYRALTSRARERVVPGGWMVAEVHSDYAEKVAALVWERGFSEIETRSDLAGLPRVMVARYYPDQR